MHSSGKYQNTRKIYQETYKIYSDFQKLPVKPEKIIVEDSNSGYEFFKGICDAKGITCLSAGGKSNLFAITKKSAKTPMCIIADGAALGPEMSTLYKQTKHNSNIMLYLPESFEWLILQSGIVNTVLVRNVLINPEEYIDSSDYFSWEQFFTKLLMTETEGTYLQYRKSKLNPVYLHEKNQKSILRVVQGIEL